MPSVDRTTDMTRAGLNLIKQALSIYDAELRLAVANRPFQQMFNLPKRLVETGASFSDTIRHLLEAGEYGDVLDPEGFVAARVEQARAFQPHYLERQRANGRTIAIEGSPLPGGGWVTVYTDITEIKNQEALLRTRSEALSDQLLDRAEQLAQTNRELAATIGQLEETKRGLAAIEARTRLTTEMMPAHIAHVDRDGRYTFTNRRLKSIFPGRSPDILGQQFADVLGPETTERLLPHFERALNGEPSALEFTDRKSARRIRTAFTPDPGPEGGAYVLSTDVTEDAQARAALAQTHKRELATQLTSGLAHDFSNLLTIILGLQGRLARAELPAEAKELVAATQAAARRGGALLDKIATISGPREMHVQPTDVAGFFDALLPLARAPLPENITLACTLETGHPRLMLDTGGLQDALLNLVLNARDAIGPAGGHIAIRAADVQETWLEITVSDSGPGFSEAVMKSALDPFFTTKGAEGTGLGLPQVYDFAKLAGGQLKLGNTARGGQVRLNLPLRAVSIEGESALVLLVDDEPEIRAATRDLLTDLGHRVIEAGDADEAIALADLPEIDWVVSDINLGAGMSGVDLCGHLAERRAGLRLALTTALPLGDGLRGRGATRWPVLAKPVASDDLSALMGARA